MNKSRRQLGCPLGTVRSRLARARDLLTATVNAPRPGPAGSDCRGGVRSDASAASASGELRRLTPVPPELVRSTIRAASQSAAGQGDGHVAAGLARFAGPTA